MEMMISNQKMANHRMASSRLDEKNFRNCVRFENDHSKFKEWRCHFLNAVRESDDDFANLLETFERHEEVICPLTSCNLVQLQQSINLHVRLSNCTTGYAHDIVNGVGNNNGAEAWRQLNRLFDPKTDQRMMTLVLEIIEWKIKGKGKDILSGLQKWENKVAELSRDHNERLGDNIQRAMLMNILPVTMQSRIREHLDRLKTYKDSREKIVSLSHSLAGLTDIGNLDNTSDSSSDSWEGWWQGDDGGWYAPEGAEEDPTDI